MKSRAIILGNGDSRDDWEEPHPEKRRFGSIVGLKKFGRYPEVDNQWLIRSHSDIDLWGCNLAFKAYSDLDYLVATDANRQHEIIVSEGATERPTLCFLDWVEIPADENMPNDLREAGMNVIQNDYKNGMMCVSGYRKTLYVTYLGNTHRNIESIKMSEIPRRFSSGGLAMWLAAQKGYKTIFLKAFGDEKHAYKEYSGIDQPHIDHWKEEREFIINEFKEIDWRYV